MANLSEAMPTILKHEGVWQGIYRHLSVDGTLLDMHRTIIRCEFPASGAHPYIQHNLFIWDDGRRKTMELPGTLRDGKLWWDVETFRGCAWESEGLILLNLERKDDPGANFFEVIALGSSGVDRARTWHWFRDGKLFMRTLCDERRVSKDPFAAVEG